MAKIIITISKQGQTEIHVAEAKGEECTEMTENLEAKLGEVKERKLSSEYYEKPKITNTVFYKRKAR